MKRIQIIPENIAQISAIFKKNADILHSMSYQINHMLNDLDWEIRYKDNITQKANLTTELAKKLADDADWMSTYLQNSATKFQEADAQNRCNIEQMTCRIPDSKTLPFFALGALTIGAVNIPIVKDLPWIRGCISKPIKNGVDAFMVYINKRKELIKYNWARSARLDEILKMDVFRPSADIETRVFNKKGYSHEQCKGFAKAIYQEMFQIALPSTKGNDYELEDSLSLSQVGQIVSTKKCETTEEMNQLIDRIKALFQSAKVGDMVQMKWLYSATAGNGPHSAILGGVNESGIWLYDANNGSPTNVIKNTFMSFSDYAKKIQSSGNGVTIYTPI